MCFFVMQTKTAAKLLQKEGGVGAAKNDTEDINEQIDDQKLYEKKFAETEDLNESRQKKPDGRDKSKDTKDAETLIPRMERITMIGG